MNQDNKNLFKLVIAAGLVVIIICIISIVKTFSNNHKTGLLSVKSNDPKATLSISQPGKQAQVIGVGTAKVRLLPGQYLLSASDKGRNSAKAVSITLKRSTRVTLDPTSVAALPLVSDINFQGVNGLTDSGFSDTQMNLFEYYIFSYKPRAKTVDIASSSIQPGPHNPDTDIGFLLKFNLLIDSANYRAVASYIGFNDLSLKLYNADGKLVFSSR